MSPVAGDMGYDKPSLDRSDSRYAGAPGLDSETWDTNNQASDPTDSTTNSGAPFLRHAFCGKGGNEKLTSSHRKGPDPSGPSSPTSTNLPQIPQKLTHPL